MSGNLDNRACRVVVSPRLIIRQSCGCPPTGSRLSFSANISLEPTLKLSDLAHAMAKASLIEARNSLLEDLQGQCTSFLEEFLNSLRAAERKYHSEVDQARARLDG